MKLRASIVFSFLMLTHLAYSAKGPDAVKKDENRNVNRPTLAAGCSPSSRITYLEYNNVRTRVETGGLWWQDRPNNRADYEVPKGSNSFAIYAGGLWLGGTDVNGQLKAAATRYGPGSPNGGIDYWTGPLDTTGTAEIDATTCDEWDRFFEIEKQDVLQFVLYRRALEAGTAAEDFPDYQVPSIIEEWPANGDIAKGQANKLAPYVDVNGDGFYDHNDGDYPYYDLGTGFNTAIPDSLLNSNGQVDCRARRSSRSESATRPLFGDKTYWWIFNDKGNLHTETSAPSVGMEIHAQAFAFATNDEVNDMTFYNFELINRSTFTLTDTYFANYVDSDLGDARDDYVGCDVGRGFGYCYNGDDLDEDFNGQTGYGATPAVIGIDFFEGPYQDADGINNQVGILPGQALNGLGYFDPTDPEPDAIIDNERFGMRRFVYYNIGGGQNGDPSLAIHFYNYMRGIWQNGQPMRHGGDGLNSNGVENIPTAFMFPGDSDPLHWGTTDENGITTVPNNTNWTEANPGGGSPNAPGDRRFLQSAGPFTLEPGNVNDITVGVVFGQAESGGRFASLDKAITADDKAQALFDNCFQVLDGPDAPELTIQELDQELILYLSNSELSNNFNELYEETDPNIVTPDTLLNMNPPQFYDNKYRFQGYQIYQLKSADISVSQLDDISVARLAFQCDIKDDVTTLINFTFDESLGANFPIKKVEGSNEGIVHSFRVTEDLFAQGNSQLVNYKTYYYIAVAYAYNEFKPYVQDQAPDLANPFAGAYDGQKVPYLASRKTADGGSVASVAAIPHSITPEQNGTVVNSNYGDLIGITRLQGQGNGNNGLELTDATLNRLMEEKNWEDENSYIDALDYKLGAGPLTVKVVDPLNVVDGKFYFKMLDEKRNGNVVVTDTANWMIWREGGDTVYSTNTIKTRTEQLLFDPNWGLSILVEQTRNPGLDRTNNNGFISSRVEYSDPTKPWLSGVPDGDGGNPYNWILSGSASGTQAEYGDRTLNGDLIDPNEDFENILEGTISPYALVGFGTGSSTSGLLINKPGFNLSAVQNSRLQYLNSFVLVFTKDKSKWSRCPVIELQEISGRTIANDNKYEKRSLGSVDKDGNMWQPGDPVDLTDPESPSYIDSTGMGWFPGYAINMETGERMNIAFGEDSWFGVDNGADMIWNPTDRLTSGSDGSLVWGGKHVIYLFRKTLDVEPVPTIPGLPTKMPEYDSGEMLKEMLNSNIGIIPGYAWRACSWVAYPMLAENQTLLSTDAKVYVKVAKPYDVKYSDLYDTTIVNGAIQVDSSLMNEGRPVYAFETRGKATVKNNTTVLEDALGEINIVPNPYYAISDYETSAIDNRVKLINLPENCQIKIYNMSGTLIREYSKADPLNYLDWDLSNQVGIPISSGVYIVHIDVPGVGEKILKWFGVMRPVDLNNF
tara:strand:- start:1656 stop:5906 length:4251 start_codon:yes stop_codon:yes gene_type:complete